MARILVVEDEPLIAMMVEDWLAELGHQVAGSADTVAEALRLVAAVPCDGAIVDVSLRREHSLPVAEELRRRSIPFVIATGQRAEHTSEGAFAGAPVLTKPFDFGDFTKALAGLLAAAPS